MKFNSETYDKLYHATPAEDKPASGGVVEPQPKAVQKENPKDSPKQTTNTVSEDDNTDNTAGDNSEEETAAPAENTEGAENG